MDYNVVTVSGGHRTGINGNGKNIIKYPQNGQ